MTRQCYLLISLLAIAGVAEAHDALAQSSFGAGFYHPLSGVDHLLALMGVGLWSSHIGGRARWIVPLVFVTVMLVGARIGNAGLSVSAVEIGTVFSVLLFGALVAKSVQAPTAIGAAIAATFAVFHGLAHGGEWPASGSVLTYLLGLTAASMVVLAGSVLAGQWFRRKRGCPLLLRAAGGLIASVGGLLLLNIGNSL